jgi:hypothetical protein
MQINGGNNTIVFNGKNSTFINVFGLHDNEYNVINDLVKEWVVWYKKTSPETTAADAWAAIELTQFATYEDLVSWLYGKIGWARNRFYRQKYGHSFVSLVIGK